MGPMVQKIRKTLAKHARFYGNRPGMIVLTGTQASALDDEIWKDFEADERLSRDLPPINWRGNGSLAICGVRVICEDACLRLED